MEYHFNKTPMEGDLSEFPGPVSLILVDETKWESFWDKLIRKYHYLGYDSVIGARLKYLIALGERIVGAISFCSAAFKLGMRDKYVGWDEKTRLSMLPRLVNNNRFLILPWVKIHNLASHTLALSLKLMRVDWEKRYGVSPCMVETFVDREKYVGTCYIAANWTYLGETKGFGRVGKEFVYHGNKKALYVMVIDRRFASTFLPDVGRLPNVRKEILSMINEISVHFPVSLDELGVKNISLEIFNQSLADHLLPYVKFLGRKEHRPHMVAVIKGLLSDLERKNLEAIALAFEDASEVRNLVNFMMKGVWDDQGMLEEYQKELLGPLSRPDGMITGDSCDFPKKGNNSVGVARQYYGPRGKMERCQSSVMIGYASLAGCGLLDYELYMPIEWFDEKFEERRKACRVPEDLEYKAKSVMLSEMINREYNSGRFMGKYVGLDIVFGRDRNLLDSLHKDLIYFADIQDDHLLFIGRPEMGFPEYKGRGRKPKFMVPSFPPRRAKDIAEDNAFPWNVVPPGFGAKDPVIVQDKCLKVVEALNNYPGEDVWLYIGKLRDGTIKYALCGESLNASVEAIRVPAFLRWSIDRCFTECRKFLGMGHYEVRTWPAWRRHILFTYLANLFIAKLRRDFPLTEDAPALAPLVNSPERLSDYVKAAENLRSDQSIDSQKDFGLS
jgi:SRSO17 transposase